MRSLDAIPSESRNQQLMVTLDNAFNARDWKTFERMHAREVVVHWPGWATEGAHDHRRECADLCAAFPDCAVDNDPYPVLFAAGDWTCMVTSFHGTMTGPMRGPDGQSILPTGKRFSVPFCTVARWANGQIVEEHLFYDVAGMMNQIGLGA